MLAVWRKGQRRSRVVGGVALVLLLAAAAGGWLLARGSEPAAATTTTVTVSTETVRDTVAVSGTIEPAATADLDFAVSGTVTRVLVEAGDTVKVGDALARVDDTALVATRRAALATLEAAVAQLDEDEDDGADDTRLAADQTAVVAARSALTEARGDVDDATLRATIRGTVTAVGLEEGDVTGSSASGGTGATGGTTTETSTPAVSIVSAGRFVLDATVAAADAGQVGEGLQAEITVSGVTDTVYGTVTEVGRVAETSSPGTAVFAVSVEVTGTRDDLYAGTTADATVIVEQRPDVLTVSTGALLSDGDTTYVEKVGENGTERTDVEIGATYGATTQVVSGLAEGDVVEVQGFTRGPGTTGTNGGGEGADGQQQRPQLDGGFPGGGGAGFPGAGTGGTP